MGWLIFILFLAMLPYLLGPILVRNKLRFKSSPITARLDPEELPADIVGHFSQPAQGLATNEFAPVVYFSMAEMTPGSFAFIALWTNPTTIESVSVVVNISNSVLTGKSRKTVYSEFYTRFDNGFGVLTNNSPELRAFQAVPERDVVNRIGEENISVLYRLHASRSARLAPPGAKRVLPEPGSEMEWFLNVVDQDFAQQVKTGYLESLDGGQTYQPTWQGAYLITAKQLFPVKQILRWQMGEKAERDMKLTRGAARK